MTGATRSPGGQRRLIARIYRSCMNSIALSTNLVLVSIVLVVLGSVAVRYFGIFRGSLDWATEYGRFAIVWVAMLGSAMALDRGAHVGIDLSPVLPKHLHRPLRIAAAALVLLFVAVLAWQGFVLCLATTRQISPALGLPMSLAYLAVPVGAAIMALQSVLFAAAPDVLGQWSPAPPERDRPNRNRPRA